MQDAGGGSVNIAGPVLQHVRRVPDMIALVVPQLSADGTTYSETTMSYRELGERIAQCQSGLAGQGFKRGSRIILMAPLSVDLYALLLGIFAAGMSAVFIDTGMSRKKVMQAISDSQADAIVSVGALLKYRLLLPALWGLKKFSVDSSGWGLSPMANLFAEDAAQRDCVATDPDEQALITFTSGSTGRPKGADRTQGLLTAQHLALAEHFPNQDHEVDMPCFPVVTLHNLCSGIPTILPAVDFRAPATVDPIFVFEQIERWGVTRMSGAPAYIDKIVAHLEATDGRETRIRGLAVGGAPVPIGLCERILAVFPNCDAQVVYGSTEAEPIASVGMVEVVAEAERAEQLGLLVGTCAHVAEVALVSLPADQSRLDERGIEPYRVATGTPGELIVSGPHVNRGYLNNPTADQANKLYGNDGVIWHRTGDVATFDEQNRLWLQGRVKDLVQYGELQLQPLPVEAALDKVEGVERAALIQTQKGARCVLALEASRSLDDLQPELDRELGRFQLQGIKISLVSPIPMDYRHNSKIDRVGLRARLES